MSSSRYDAELQMFCEIPREPSVTRLQFARWLAEHGKSEHGVESAPMGDFALLLDTPPEPSRC